VAEDTQVAARNMIVEAADPVAGRVRMAGNPIKMPAFADPHARAPSPELGQHRATLVAELEAARAR